MDGRDSVSQLFCSSCWAEIDRKNTKQRSGKALASFVLGLLSPIGTVVTGVPAIVFGLTALGDIRASAGRSRGKAFAVIGVVCGALLSLLIPVAFFAARSRAPQGPPPSGEVIVKPNSEWAWLHPVDGVDPKTQEADFHQTFFLTDYNDSSWSTGKDSNRWNGGFGYGDPMLVDIGTPAEGLRYTAYLRHRFRTEREYSRLELQLHCDDGIIIYLDSREVARKGMPDTAQAEAYELLAVGIVAPNRERVLGLVPIPGTITAGEHLLAISVHNQSPTSSDLSIGAIALYGTPVEEPTK